MSEIILKKKKEDDKIQKNPTPPKLKRKDIFEIGHFVSITNRSGVTFSGQFKGYVQGNYYLVDVEIAGKKYRIEAPWVLIEMNTVSHIFPKNSKLVPLKEA